MSVALRISVLLLCMFLTAVVLRLVSKESLLLKYSLLWLVLVILLVTCALFPDGLVFISRALGFETVSNFALLIGLFCLLAISLSLSVIVSKQAGRIKNLTQRLALVEYQQIELSRELGDEPYEKFAARKAFQSLER